MIKSCRILRLRHEWSADYLDIDKLVASRVILQSGYIENPANGKLLVSVDGYLLAEEQLADTRLH